ncbi:MAG: copper homeostasis protein CutC [Clostridiales bacterium]|nr:copper homeostasis protein CutC [Clostridiales bacterium]
MKKGTLEVCVDSFTSAQQAINAGATRLELCSSLIIGGISPSPIVYRQIRKITSIPIHVMVRPRHGDFLYTEDEMDRMIKETAFWEKEGACGIVTGMLLANGELDVERMKRIIEQAGKMKVILHRAFDVSKDPFSTLEAGKKIGITGILTSGQATEAMKGLQVIKELQLASEGIQIIAGSGVTAENMNAIREKTGVTAFHMSGKVRRESEMIFQRKDLSMGETRIEEYGLWECSYEKIAQARKVLEESME